MELRYGMVDIEKEGRNEMVVSWKPHAGKPITFRLKNQQIRVDPAEGWMHAVPPEAQDAVFNTFLAHYRERSPVEHNLKTAAIGIAEDGHVFIGVNTEHRGEDSYKRDCAEQNMVNALRQSRSVPKDKKLAKVYVMGGVEPGMDKTKPTLVCPCGSCTDMLAKEMKDAEAPIVVFPVNEGKALPAVSDTARTVHDLQAGQGWHTTIGALNPHRKIMLDADGQNWSQAAFNELASHMPYKAHETAPKRFMGSLARNDVINARPVACGIDDKMGVPDIARLVQARIYDALAAPRRLGGNPEFDELTTLEARKEYISTHVKAVQVATVRLGDGSFHTAVTIKSDFDRASSHALERAALDAQESNQHITDVWFTEFNPRALKEGWGPTPTKESIERTIKRGNPKSEVKFHIVPFMRLGLKLSEFVPQVSNFSASELLPGYFTGNGVAKTVPDNRVQQARSQRAQPLIDSHGRGQGS